MQKNKKLWSIMLLVIVLILLTSSKVLGSSIADYLMSMEYTEEFKQYLELSEEKRKEVIQPQIVEIPKTNIESTNPLKRAKLLGSTLDVKYTLKSTIPDNVIVKNQESTNSCWAFSTLSSLETNLALNNKHISKTYDFSERHMNYATSRIFLNNTTNIYGFNRTPADAGNWTEAEAYLTNGMGAIEETQMVFENNSNTLDISSIQNKTVTSQVYDTIHFPSYESTDDTTEIKKQMKEHIKNYGSIYAGIHGAALDSYCCNIATGAIYCNDATNCEMNHAVSIIGWDDDYSISNFNEDYRPTSNGAWIVKNSWGEKLEVCTLLEIQEEIFTRYPNECAEQGWTQASQISDEFAKQFLKDGYIIEDDKVFLKIGDNGIMYVSYEDINVYTGLMGITKSSTNIDYENIYQYNYLGNFASVPFGNSSMYIGNIFSKKTNGTEYLTQVSIYAPETYTCRVYVNLNGTSMAKADLQPVQLKAGETETINAGYHTLEFLEPLEIKNTNFVVVVKIEGTRQNVINYGIETPIANTIVDVVEIESGKCFITADGSIEQNQWIDMSKLSQYGIVNGDSTIKAFTTSKINDNSLNNIKITVPPTKTSYFAGENFDKTGMVVTANYNNGKSYTLIGYDITNGSNLKEGQTSVTISYEGKTATQPITVEKNTVTEIKIQKAPTKTEYKAGEHFDKTGMVVVATYKDKTTKEISDYEIKDGLNLKNNQQSVTISYKGKTITQAITVQNCAIQKLEIQTLPNKTKYVEGQNFDKTGMVVIATYQDGRTVEIIDYIIENEKNLTKEQTQVTIKFENQSVTQSITVEEKAIVSISVSKMPNKTKYIQNKENLDLTGGSINVIYNDGTTEEISMTSDQIEVKGFDNTIVGKAKITLIYQSKEVEFEVEIQIEVQPIISDFSDATCDVKQVKLYKFTDDANKDYILMQIAVNNVIRNLSNDKYEYYYYLSTSQSEENIVDWVKINEEQSANNKLEFTINTKDIKNYDELSNSDVLYLYIKEVVTKEGNQKAIVSKSMLTQVNVEIQIYVDNALEQNKNSGTSINTNNTVDNTTATGKIPQTGKNMIIVILITIIAVTGTVLYIKYNKLNKNMK